MEKILTIVIPTYNMQDYLRRCLDSLIVPEEQMKQLEVLVINDGSKDNSSAIAHEYQDKYPDTFRVIDKENGNYGSCVNRGLKEATGKYIKILDVDNRYANEEFVDFLKILSEIDVDLVVNDYVRIYNSFRVAETLDMPVGMKRALLKVVSQVNPDVAVCHNLSGFSISAWDVFKAKNIPVVQVLHDQYLLCPNSNAFKNGKICEKQCTVCHMMRLPHRKASCKVDAVVGVSKYVLDRMVSRGYFEGSQKYVIHNARQFPDIPTPKPWDGKSPLHIGYIGTLSRVKGVEWLIKSFMALPDINATLAIAGKGETPEYEEHLHQLASADKRISFSGYTKPENHYPLIHLSVVPSLWPDTFPTVAFESCAYHVPVIATNVGGLPEIIKDGVNGILVDANDKESLKTAFCRIYADIDALEGLMLKARESVGEFMNVLSMKQKYRKILDMVI